MTTNRTLSEFNLPQDSQIDIVVPRSGRNYAAAVNGFEIASGFKTPKQAAQWAKKNQIPVKSSVQMLSVFGAI